MKRSKLFPNIRSKKWTVAAALAVGMALALFTAIPRAITTAATQRDLPIYCVQKDSKVCSLTFDAAWGDAKVRQSLILTGIAALSLLSLFYHRCAYFARIR